MGMWGFITKHTFSMYEFYPFLKEICRYINTRLYIMEMHRFQDHCFQGTSVGGSISENRHYVETYLAYYM